MRSIVIAIIVIIGTVLSYPTDVLNTDSSQFHSMYIERKFVPPLSTISVKERWCLAQAIYYEAGNQTAAGKEAVALVIINRALSVKHPNTICGVVHESHIVRLIIEDTIIVKRICQFSFWCTARRAPVIEIWKESDAIAKRVLQNYWNRDIISTLNHAMYFHAEYVSPTWKKRKVFLGKVGKHLFYADKPMPQFI